MTITVNGTPIANMSLHDIIAGASVQLQQGSYSNSYYLNRDLIRMFGTSDTITEHVLESRFRRLYLDRGHTEQFVAFRAAQLVCWGVEQRLVEAIPGDSLTWKLVEREPVFEFAGRERDQNAIRSRGWLPVEKDEGEAAWAKELKRRERSRIKDEKTKAAAAAAAELRAAAKGAL